MGHRILAISRSSGRFWQGKYRYFAPPLNRIVKVYNLTRLDQLLLTPHSLA